MFLKKTKGYFVYTTLLIWITNSFSCVNNHIVFSNDCMIERPVCQENQPKSKTLFYLFTSQNKGNPEALHKCDLRLAENTHFNTSNPTVFFIPGYLVPTCIVTYIRETKDELLKRRDYNVILVDWSYYSSGDFINSIREMKKAINSTVALIDNIKDQTHISYKTIHLIGHSLGAHFAGIVGQTTKIYRITGLDPCGPGFYGKSDDEMLDRNDADFVDAIHTNPGRCLPFLGYEFQVGDEDFYVERSSSKKSCYNTIIESILKLDILGALRMLLFPPNCYHIQSLYYFKSSINSERNCCFLGKRCRNYKDAMENATNCVKACDTILEHCSIMGMDWPLTYKRKLAEQRTYTVKVQNTCPYCSCHLDMI